MSKNSPDILLVNPPLSFEERYGVKEQSGGNTPPLGLAYIASYLRENGIIPEILDAAILNLSIKETADIILSKKPKIVGFTAATIAIFNADETAKIIKQKNKNITIILGGSHITAVPYETMQLFPIFEIGVMGEGEITALELCRYLLGKSKIRDISKINGILYRVDSKIKITMPREFIKDLTIMPYPAWDLLPDLATYYCPPVHTIKRLPGTLMVTSRGCPGQCTFCDNKVFGRKFRIPKADYIFGMVKTLYNDYGIREFQFRDDNFTVNKKIIRDFCKLVIEDKLDITWSCAARVDMINFETLKIMKKAGCWSIWYGIESGTQRILDIIKKHTTIEGIEKTIHDTRKAGIEAGGFFMMGMPTETEEEIEQTIKFALKLPLNDFHITFLTPFPGAELYNTASQYGSFDNDWHKLSGWKPVFIPDTLTEDIMIRLSKKAFKKFYLRPRIILQYILKLRSWQHIKTYWSGLMAYFNFVFKKHA